MEESNFDRLLHRYLHDQLTPQEKTKFTAWINLLQKENAGDLELSPADQEKLFQRITSNTDSIEDVIALYPKKPLLKRIFANQWAQIAAMVIIMLSASLFTWDALRNKNADLTQSSSKEKVILNDGTLVWIQTGSKFLYYEKDGERHAELIGQALFEVAKIPDRPFIIACGSINVMVLGTSFSLKTGEQQVELNVFTGKVSLTSMQDKVGVDVTPNEKVIYTTTGEVERSVIDGGDISALTADTEYNMKFRSESMKNVIKSIARRTLSRALHESLMLPSA